MYRRQIQRLETDDTPNFVVVRWRLKEVLYPGTKAQAQKILFNPVSQTCFLETDVEETIYDATTDCANDALTPDPALLVHDNGRNFGLIGETFKAARRTDSGHYEIVGSHGLTRFFTVTEEFGIAKNNSGKGLVRQNNTEVVPDVELDLYYDELITYNSIPPDTVVQARYDPTRETNAGIVRAGAWIITQIGLCMGQQLAKTESSGITAMAGNVFGTGQVTFQKRDPNNNQLIPDPNQPNPVTVWSWVPSAIPGDRLVWVAVDPFCDPMVISEACPEGGSPT